MTRTRITHPSQSQVYLKYPSDCSFAVSKSISSPPALMAGKAHCTTQHSPSTFPAPDLPDLLVLLFRAL